MNGKLPQPDGVLCMHVDLFVNQKLSGVTYWEEPVKNSQ